MNIDHEDQKLSTISPSFDSPEDEASWIQFIEETAAQQAYTDREMEKFFTQC